MPSKSPAQHHLMMAAAHTKGGYGGVPQSVGKEFVKADEKDSEDSSLIPDESDQLNEPEEVITDSGVLVDDEISPNISLTPEGYLLCEGATFARTGNQEYKPNEIPVEPNKEGKIIAHRNPEHVFDNNSLASYTGKSITLEHPREMVGPKNWKQHSVGIVQRAYREGNYVKGDLLVTDADAIRRIQDQGMRKLSVGYNSKLEDLGSGHVNTTNIRANHVALTLNPRGGDVCMIKDSSDINNKNLKETKMSQKQTIKRSLWEILGLMDSKVNTLVDEMEMTDNDVVEEKEMQHEKAEDTVEKSAMDLIKELSARIEKLEALNKVEEVDQEKEMTDAVETDKDEEVVDACASTMTDEDADGEYPIGDSLNTIISKSEILVPGFKPSIQLTDSNIPTNKDLVEVKRQVLNKVLLTDSKAIQDIAGSTDISKLSAETVNVVFNALASIKSTKNNSGIKATANVYDSNQKTDKPFEVLINKYNQINKH